MSSVAIAAPAGQIKLGGRTYLVDPPNDRDMRAIGVFVSNRCRDALSKLVNHADWPKLTEAQQDRLLSKVETVGEAAPSASEIMTVLVSPEAVRFTAWLLLRKRHPDVTKEMVDGWIDAKNCEQLFFELEDVTGMANLGNSAGLSGVTPATD